MIKTTAEIKKFGYEIGDGYTVVISLDEKLKGLAMIYELSIHPPREEDQLDQLTIKNIVYSLLLKKYLDKDNKCLHNNPTFKPRYWLKRCEFINSQA